MIYALGVAGLLVCYLLFLLWKAERAHQQDREALLAERRLQDVFARDMLPRQSRERDQWMEERQLLLNRIQAPELATGQAAALSMPEPRKVHVGFDSDEEYWAAQREMNGE